MPKRADLDCKEGRQESEADWCNPGRRLFFCEKPPAKPADKKGHGQEGRCEHANDVADKGGQ